MSGTTTGAAVAVSAAEPPVLARRDGALTRITLHRPRALNALNREMADLVIAELERATGDGSSAIVLDGSGERGFCGGGDVKALAAGSVAENLDFLRREYLLDYRIHTSAVPVVAIMHGITMGGGIGLGGHAAVRVVTETSRLAMPEARIGILPDVGGNLLLSRAPGRLGELLGMTAGDMTAGDAIALGFADFFVPSERLAELRSRLSAGTAAREAVAAVAEAPPVSELLGARKWFDPIARAALGPPGETFAHPASAARRLLAGLEASPDTRAGTVAATARSMSPTSLAITLAQLDRTRAAALGLHEVLADDLRVMGRMVALPDFAEGVRAQLIDRDAAPRWRPARAEQLDASALAAILDPAYTPGETPLELG